MKVLGYSIPMAIVLLVVFIIGAKNPGILAKIPGLNRI
jgi:hypothetical protein